MTQANKRIASMLALAGAAALLAGCAGNGAGGASDAAPVSGEEGEGTNSITIIHAPINYELPFIAQQEGYFADAGLEVTIKADGTPQDNLAQIMGNSADLTIVSWDTIVTATAEGIPVLGVAGQGVVSSTVDTSGIVVRADSGIASAADLKGKTVVFNDLGGGPHIVTMQALAEVGLGAADFEAVKMPFASMQTALEGGQVDAVFPSDSFYEQISSLPENTVIANPTREFRAGLPITMWAATGPWLEANPGTASRFIEAMEKAAEFYDDEANLEAILQIRQDVGGVSREQAEAMQGEVAIPLPLGVTQSVTDALVEFGAVENADGVSSSRDMIWRDAKTSE